MANAMDVLHGRRSAWEDPRFGDFALLPTQPRLWETPRSTGTNGGRHLDLTTIRQGRQCVSE